MGNIFHRELFSQGNMTGFVLFAIVLLPFAGGFRRHRFLAFICIMHLVAFAAHQHIFRYIMPFYVLVYMAGTAGFIATYKYVSTNKNILGMNLINRRKITATFLLLFIILLFPFIRPLRSIYNFDDREEFIATMDVVRWMDENIKKGEIPRREVCKRC